MFVLLLKYQYRSLLKSSISFIPFADFELESYKLFEAGMSLMNFLSCEPYVPEAWSSSFSSEARPLDGFIISSKYLGVKCTDDAIVYKYFSIYK